MDLVEARASFQPHNLLSTQEEDTRISCAEVREGSDYEVSIYQGMESASSGPFLVPRPFLGPQDDMSSPSPIFHMPLLITLTVAMI